MLAFGGAVGTFVGPSTPGSAYAKAHHLAARVGDHLGCFGYIRGGMGALSQALATVLRAHGGEIRTETTVERILVRDGTATVDEVQIGLLSEGGLSNLGPSAGETPTLLSPTTSDSSSDSDLGDSWKLPPSGRAFGPYSR